MGRSQLRMSSRDSSRLSPRNFSAVRDDANTINKIAVKTVPVRIMMDFKSRTDDGNQQNVLFLLSLQIKTESKGKMRRSMGDRKVSGWGWVEWTACSGFESYRLVHLPGAKLRDFKL